MKKNRILPVLLLVLSPIVISSCTHRNPTSSSTSGSGQPVDTNATYRVTLNACSGNAADNQVVTGKYGDAKTLPNGPERTGYIFSGWSSRYSKHTQMGDKGYMVNSTFTMPGYNQVLYAVYRKTSITEEVAKAELEKWKAKSEENHLYYHYFRFDNQASSYADWDVWAWSYAPTAGEGAKFDWVGRTQSKDKMSATGDATVDQYAGAYVDIDLTKTYYGGWDNGTKKILNTEVKFNESEQIGLQIVKTSTRTSAAGFWTNDGSNLYVKLSDYAVDLGSGKKCYHIFVVQDNVQDVSALPKGEADPFEGDTGSNVTYGNNKYNNVNWGKSANLTQTSKDFMEVGVGYQIMVSSFADSDGDGFGDIYGITQKLDYLQKLGVKALWLTPIQLSDSYHGYDITDYEKVDPKFGSKESPASKAAGKVDSDTALEDYKELINKAHEKGMKIVMDLVLNHTSTSNAWYVRSANLDDHFRGYYQWGNHNTQPQIKDINNWYPYGSHPYSYYAKFGSSMPELNFAYVDTRTAVEEMSVYWARDIGVDGFRLDAIKHIFMENEVAVASSDTIISDVSASGDYSSDLTKNLQFFRELKAVVTKCSKKDVFFVGENFDGHAYHCAPYYEAFDSLFDFYSYFNLTSGAATGRKNTTSAYGTVKGYMVNSSPYQTSADTNLKGSNAALKKADGSPWNFVEVYKTYNKYRGDTSLPGLFTSNHDIARVINRVAGDGTPEGLTKQGNVTTSNYASMEQSADCVKIAELMMPGLTWVYYGDEIGMTGNFPAGYDAGDVANIPYADLWYRQPMKWVANGTKGDGKGTTDYYVTGSAMRVEQDAINKSNSVKPALEQMEDANSEYSILKKFIELKTKDDEVGKALRVGSIAATEWVDGELCSNVLTFSRTSGSTTIKVVVNFNGTGLGSNLTLRNGALSGTVLASYNGATQTALPPYSAIVIKA